MADSHKVASLLDIRASFKVMDDFFNITAICSPSNAGDDWKVLSNVSNVDGEEIWLVAFLIMAIFAHQQCCSKQLQLNVTVGRGSLPDH